MSEQSTWGQSWKHSALVQLVLARLREFYREPEAVFWVYGFPLLMATALGIAFRNQPAEKFTVDVIGAGEAVNKTVEALAASTRFATRVSDDAEGRGRLRAGKTDLLVRIGSSGEFEYQFDFTRKESQVARAAVDDALQRAAGRRDPVPVRDLAFEEPGGRYIDFLVPGLLGMSLMGGGLWGVGYVIVDMRIRRLLKRFLATPMKRSHFLAAIMASRLLFLLPEVLVLLVFSRLAFGVKTHGSLLAVLGLILLGAIAFAGIGLLVASRAKTLESVSGLMNLVMLPMWVLSGIFFSSDRFPEVAQPLIKALPLTLVIDALRAIMIDGAAVSTQIVPIVGLTLWATLSFGIALRLFRWN
ncbi:MAG: ABC transporter permease [Pirellulales bacterium]